MPELAPEHPKIYDCFIIDGNEMLCHVTWPKTSNVQYNFVKAVDRKNVEVYVVFDKYNDYSTKNYERDRRSGNKLYPSHKLTLETDLTSRDIVMKNTCNKIQLNNLMCEANIPRTLRMMGPDTCIYKHEEADITIIRYAYMLIQD